MRDLGTVVGVMLAGIAATWAAGLVVTGREATPLEQQVAVAGGAVAFFYLSGGHLARNSGRRWTSLWFAASPVGEDPEARRLDRWIAMAFYGVACTMCVVLAVALLVASDATPVSSILGAGALVAQLVWAVYLRRLPITAFADQQPGARRARRGRRASTR
jgi:hypothetical protein